MVAIVSLTDRINNGVYENKMDFRTTERSIYRIENARLLEVFRKDLEHEYGMIGHPKADVLWRLAYDRGHSAGYNEIYNEYDELSVLITK
jgi:hypothetical protein